MNINIIEMIYKEYNHCEINLIHSVYTVVRNTQGDI